MYVRTIAEPLFLLIVPDGDSLYKTRISKIDLKTPICHVKWGHVFQIDQTNSGQKIFYWRTSNGSEVDFVLYGPKGLLAFEIKRTARVTSDMISGLKLFLSDYPTAKAYFVCAGNRRMYEEDIIIAPIPEDLKDLRTLLLNK